MTNRLRAAALLVCSLLAPLVTSAQVLAPRPAGTPGRVPTAQPAPAPPTVPAAQPSYGDDMVAPQVSSILRHRAWHEDFTPNNSYGYRNPGNVGRVAEYYPPGNKFQNDSPQHITARIGLGGVPDRAEQLASFNAGTARYSALQTHIDRYGRPMMGFGLGFRFGW